MAPSEASRRRGGGKTQPRLVKLCLVPAGNPHACGAAQGAGLALAGPLREAWRRPWGPPHGGDELTDAPAEEFLELDGGRVHLRRGGRTAAAASGRDSWSGWGAARPGRAWPVRAWPARASGGALRNARPVSSRPPCPHPCGRQAEPAGPNRTFLQVRVCGAGGARTHDRRIMRTTAPCTVCASCTDITRSCRR
jgi:hypothetical protein